MRPSRHHSRHLVARSAFTLLEILIALGLLLLLMAAVSQTISIYVSLSTLGRNEAEQAQIGRAVLQQIATDIRCLSFVPVPEDELEGASGSDEETASEDELPEDDGGTAVAPPPSPTGIVGNTVDLLLYTSRPDRRMEYVDAEAAVSPTDRVSDALAVRYFLARSGESGLSGEFARTALGPAVVKEVVGLARMQGDRAMLIQSMDDNNLESQVQATRLLAAEVVDLQFRYYSNTEWFDEWDSQVSNSLPQAIEIRIQVQLQPEVEQSRFAVATQAPEDEAPIIEFRRIVPIQLIPPVDMEAL